MRSTNGVGRIASCGKQFGARRIAERTQRVFAPAGFSRQLGERSLHVQNILGRVVVHVAQLANVPILRRKFHLGRIENGASFIDSPCKVVAVVVEAHIGVLRSIKAAAFAVRHRRVEPRHNLARGSEKVLAHIIALESMHVIAQQLGVVVEHLLEVRHHPALIHAVAMKTSGKLVVDAASRHLFERRSKCFASPLIVVAHGRFEQQVERRRMGKLGLRTEPAVARVELRDDRLGNLFHEGQVQRAPASGKALILLNGSHDAAGRLQSFVAALAPRLRHRQ